MISWHLSNQGIHWPVSLPLDFIRGSGLELIEVDHDIGTGFGMDHKLKPGLFYSEAPHLGLAKSIH